MLFPSRCVSIITHYYAVTELDVDQMIYQFGSLFIDKNILQMTVAETKDVADHGRGSNAPRVTQTLLEPKRWSREALEEEVPEDGRKARADFLEAAQLLVDALHIGEPGHLHNGLLGRQVVTASVAQMGTRFAVFAYE